LGLEENTLVILTSDNGGVMDDGYQDGAIENANGHLCNGNLRGYKGSLWEGGHREPFIVRWPGKVKAGATSSELISTVDMLASLAALTGQKLAPEAAPDSYNVLPALLGESHDLPLRDHLVLQSGGVNALAIRKGDWKLIPGRGGNGAQGGIGKKAAGKGKKAFKKTANGPAAGAYSSGTGIQLYNLMTTQASRITWPWNTRKSLRNCENCWEKCGRKAKAAPEAQGVPGTFHQRGICKAPGISNPWRRPFGLFFLKWFIWTTITHTIP
jgi:hypothetical protein